MSSTSATFSGVVVSTSKFGISVVGTPILSNTSDMLNSSVLSATSVAGVLTGVLVEVVLLVFFLAGLSL